MKKIFTLLLTCAFASALSAQNFMKFDATDGNGVKALNGIAHRTGTAQMEILVPTNFDLTNVSVDYQIAETDELITNPLPTNYTQPQKVTLKSPTSSKEWTITFKQVKPSTLPLEIAFSATNPSTEWTSDTEGWAGACVDAAQSRVIRFSNTTVTFMVAFSDPAEKISYDIFSVGANAFAGTFDVYTSANGVDWVTAQQFTPESPMATGGAQTYELTVSPTIRYAKWVYTNRVGNNVTMNNINITKGSGTGIENELAEANIMYVNSNNELVISDNASVAKVEVFSLIGAQVYSTNKLSNTTNLNGLAQGVYIAKATSVDGAVATLKFVIK